MASELSMSFSLINVSGVSYCLTGCLAGKLLQDEVNWAKES